MAPRDDSGKPPVAPAGSSQNAFDNPDVHRGMLMDRIRTDAYRRAIEEVVRPGDRVLDLGCGVGILSLFAARAGAEKVYAIERSPIIAVAREVARANGHDNIEFLQGEADEVELPEQVDVLVQEGFGYFVFYEGTAQIVPRVRDRWLAPGGRLIPSAVSLHGAFLTDVSIHQDLGFWRGRPYGFDFSLMNDWGFHRAHTQTLWPKQLHAETITFGHYDFATMSEIPTPLRGVLAPTTRATTYGLAGWFDLALTDNIALGTGPWSEKTHWSQVLFPFTEPFHLVPGREVQVTILPIDRDEAGGTKWQWSVDDGRQRREGDDFIQGAWIDQALRTG